MTVRAAKNILRKEIKQRVNALSEDEKLKQSQIVISKVIKHEKYLKCKRLSVFLSMNDEIKTDALVSHALTNNKTVFIPKYTATSMDMLKLDSMEDLKNLPKTKWNIKQPAIDDTSRENAIDNGGLDVIIMPGLGFSNHGDRLGRGKGYYDTYLQRLSENNCFPFLLAVAYKCQICDEIPTDDNDKPVNCVLTA